MTERPQPSPEDLALKKVLSIDEQIIDKKEMKILDGKVEYTEVQPEKLKTEVPLILAPGFAGDIAFAFKETMRTFAEKERATIAIEHPHSVKEVPESIPTHIKERPLEEVRKAAAMLEFFEQKGLNKVDALAHSEGAVYTLLAAAASPKKFRSLVLTNPAGLIGKDNLFQFTKRSFLGPGKKGEAFPGEKMVQPKESVLKGEGMLGFILHNPKKAFKDLRALTNSDVHSLLKELHDKGVRIAILAGVDDRMFPAKKLSTDLSEYSNEIDGFLSLKGGHTEILDHPEMYAKTVDSLLTSLAKKA